MRVEMNADDLKDAILNWAEKKFPGRQSAAPDITVEMEMWKVRVSLSGDPVRKFIGGSTTQPKGTITGSFELGE
jgi:hypothetical protein